jgi:HEAT repeat protein
MSYIAFLTPPENMSHETTLFLTTLDGDYDDEAPWASVNALQQLGTREVLDSAARWLNSLDPLERPRGADVLAQLGVGDGQPHAFPQEARDLLMALLRTESETRPTASAIIALGHIQDPHALPALLAFVSHENAEVRHATAFALGCFAEHRSTIPALLRLMSDPDADVRDWATFSLGVMGEADSDEIRDALLQRLDDDCGDVRQEAIAGLAKRRDRRVLPALIAALEPPQEATRVATDAASAMLDWTQAPEGLRESDLVAALRARYPDAGV